MTPGHGTATLGRTPANCLDLKARPDLPVKKARLVKLVPTETQGPQALTGRLATLVRRVKLVLTVRLVRQARPARPAKLAMTDRPDQRALTVRPAKLGLMARPGLLALQVQTARLVPLDRQVTTGLQARLVQLGRLVLLALTAQAHISLANLTIQARPVKRLVRLMRSLTG